ncbi:hypothetical protein MGYG_02238 [Nannizzia gypsea CBS 118893]|uniref:Uncharacterized protein n=1 Tax=Arthroderma gypseum (strain ATCC MYA-4604 / CBS 118893) TaxID=535722 RepID=E4UQJ5_ARTGP|nr:hypothetical protein MGYG_02238 [Nannizzia gypsea CBS 118893]EFQ99224.1 hypothetical protein MGYG_02238 [Nannizzia gypsea CBS 118893]
MYTDVYLDDPLDLWNHQEILDTSGLFSVFRAVMHYDPDPSPSEMWQDPLAKILLYQAVGTPCRLVVQHRHKTEVYVSIS